MRVLIACQKVQINKVNKGLAVELLGADESVRPAFEKKSRTVVRTMVSFSLYMLIT